MATLYLIRHAEPAITGVMLGQLDPGLSQAGTLQAGTLTDLPVAVAWSSPLRRARQTADRIGCPVIELPELREVDQGEWTGKTWAEIEAKWPAHAARKTDDWLGVAAPGGEAWAAFIERIGLGLQQIRMGPTPAAVVAHQGVNAALLHLIEGRNPLQHLQRYGEIIELDFT